MRFTGERIKFHFKEALSFFHNEEQTLRLTSASSSAGSTLLIQFRPQEHYDLQYVGQQFNSIQLFPSQSVFLGYKLLVTKILKLYFFKNGFK